MGKKKEGVINTEEKETGRKKKEIRSKNWKGE